MQPFFTPTLTLPRQGGGWFVTFYEVVIFLESIPAKIKIHKPERKENEMRLPRKFCGHSWADLL
jgi:hypothetical protein